MTAGISAVEETPRVQRTVRTAEVEGLGTPGAAGAAEVEGTAGVKETAKAAGVMGTVGVAGVMGTV